MQSKTLISCYGYIFNATIRDFDIEGAVDNFCSFFDEVVLATIKSEDDTRDRLTALQKKYKNLVIVDTDLDISKSNRWDGQLKTIAMNKCSNPIRVIVDCDERFVLGQRHIWDAMALQLQNQNHYDGFFVPVIDLWGDKNKIRANHQIGQKFRIHKNTVFERGVPRVAELQNGTFSTSMSDSTDPINEFGDLCNFAQIVPHINLHPLFSYSLLNYPYVVHHGSLSFERRAKIGNEFWKKEWEKRSNKEENVITDKYLLESEITIEHGLPID